ncbi:hypothetical protein [Streptomyces sp. 1114.5]|uniref:hypothetical protein n=1 Tax=Streptomyces sp. 1114.5 TaxID=1938830 RepID=UPI0011C44782|nr:hypothetical protein [Streptomyces sp. 1114.5]
MNARIEDARIEDARPPGRSRRVAGLAARVLARTLLLAAGLAVAAVGFGWFVDAHRETVAYLSAPACGSPAAVPGAPCTAHETGTVRAKRIVNGNDDTEYELTVARETVTGGFFDVGAAFYEDVAVGTYVDLTVWNGRVAELSYHGHRARNPDTPWLASFQVALVVAAGATLTVYGVGGLRRDTWKFPLIAYGFFVLAAFFGSLIFVGAQWPLALVLGIPVACWLLLTAMVTGANLAG